MAYWKFGLCKNRECPRSFLRKDAIQDAKRMFKRMLWRRAVKGKGKLHPEIEKLLKILPTWGHVQKTGSPQNKVLSLYSIIISMMHEMAAGMNSPRWSVDDRAIPSTPKAKWGLWDPKGNLADDSQQRFGKRLTVF